MLTMLSVYNLLTSDSVSEAIDFGYPDMPVYASMPDGKLFEMGNVRRSQISTSEGKHDIIVVEVLTNSPVEV